MSASHPPVADILPVTRVAQGIFDNGMAVAHFRGAPEIFGVDAGIIFPRLSQVLLSKRRISYCSFLGPLGVRSAPCGTIPIALATGLSELLKRPGLRNPSPSKSGKKSV